VPTATRLSFASLAGFFARRDLADFLLDVLLDFLANGFAHSVCNILSYLNITNLLNSSTYVSLIQMESALYSQSIFCAINFLKTAYLRVANLGRPWRSLTKSSCSASKSSLRTDMNGTIKHNLTAKSLPIK
jgi:hypothetical protein